MDHLLALTRDRLRLRPARESPAQRLAGALSDLAEAGALAPGTRLPAERVLALSVGMSRGTVSAAFKALCVAGLCERRHGSGTYVLARAGLDTDWTATHLASTDGAVIDLSKSVVPDPSHLRMPNIDPAELLRAPSRHGYDPMGDPRLRSLLRARLGADLIITNGAQQGLDLAARCVIRAGDTVLVEETTYPGALTAIRRLGARPVPVTTGVLVHASGKAATRRHSLLGSWSAGSVGRSRSRV
jgi:DNA-binding transcriptional MocR family regulator